MGADGRAVEAIRNALASVDMKGTVVIGEGEKDEAPMLYFGEQIGNGLEPELDVAVDPIEGTSLTAAGLPGAISVIALAERGTMFTTHVHYMEKLVVGRRAKGVIDLDMPGMSGIEVIRRAKAQSPDTEAIVLTGKSSLDTAISALRPPSITARTSGRARTRCPGFTIRGTKLRRFKPIRCS